MRTTIDLPEDLHRVALAMARDSGTTLSAAVTRLLRLALGATGSATVSRSEVTGLVVLTLGRPITSEDVRSLDDGD